MRITEPMYGKAATGGHRCHGLGAGSFPAAWLRAVCDRGPGGVMGIRLVCEVLDHYHGPDSRKLWLVAFAEKANDRTRTGWPTRDVLAHRTGRSASRVSHIAEELAAEGVLKRDGGGNRGGPARFILLPLEGPEKGAARAHPKAEVESASEAHPSAPVKGALWAHPKPKVKGAESARKGADSISLPAETGSLPLTIPSEVQPSENLVVANAPTAQTVVANFIDWVREQDGDLTDRTVGHIARQVGDLFRQGKEDRHIRKGLADWFYSGTHPSTLDSFVTAAMNATARDRAAQNGNGRSDSRPPQSTGAERAQAAIDAGRRVQAMIDGRNAS